MDPTAFLLRIDDFRTVTLMDMVGMGMGFALNVLKVIGVVVLVVTVLTIRVEMVAGLDERETERGTEPVRELDSLGFGAGALRHARGLNSVHSSKFKMYDLHVLNWDHVKVTSTKLVGGGNGSSSGGLENADCARLDGETSNEQRNC
jgi:hypothetical protein